MMFINYYNTSSYAHFNCERFLRSYIIIITITIIITRHSGLINRFVYYTYFNLPTIILHIIISNKHIKTLIVKIVYIRPWVLKAIMYANIIHNIYTEYYTH